MKAQMEKKSGILNYFKPLKEKNLNNETQKTPIKKNKQRIEALPKSTVIYHNFLKRSLFSESPPKSAPAIVEISSSSESEKESEILTQKRVSPRKILNTNLPDIHGIALDSKKDESCRKSPRKRAQKIQKSIEETIPEPESSSNSKKRKATRLESIVEDEKSTDSPNRRRSSRIKKIESEKPDSPPQPISPPRKREKLDPKVPQNVSNTPKSRRASSSKIVPKSSTKKKPDPNRIRSGSTFSSDSYSSSEEEDDEPPKDGLKKLMKRSNLKNTPKKPPKPKINSKKSKKDSIAKPDVIEICESSTEVEEDTVEIISDSEIDQHRSQNARAANLDRDLELKIAARIRKAECELIIDDDRIDEILDEIQALNKNLDVQEHWRRVSNQGVSDESDIQQVNIFLALLKSGFGDPFLGNRLTDKLLFLRSLTRQVSMNRFFSRPYLRRRGFTRDQYVVNFNFAKNG